MIKSRSKMWKMVRAFRVSNCILLFTFHSLTMFLTVLRLEYRSKFLNPKWRDAMLQQGSGGAYEVSQRMTAMVGWAATADVDNFVFDQAAERYALDEEVASKLQKSNPEAFKNVVRRLLEANGRGMWDTDDETIEKLRNLYSDADDLVEQVASSFG